MSFVYVLTDPRTQEIRYVGGTTQRAQVRLNAHISKAYKMRTHKDRWVMSLISEGVRPEIHILEEVHGPFAEVEIQWIAFLRGIGTRLANLTDGGDGCAGHIHTEESKRKMSNSSVGKPKSLEARKNMSMSATGRALSEETRNKLSLAHKGKSPSAAHRASLSKAGKGRVFSEEHRRRLSASHMGNKSRLIGQMNAA